MENFRVTRVKWILLVSSLACLVLLVIAALQENLLGEWQGHQRAYARLLAEQSADGESTSAYAVEPRQLFLAKLSRIDRCVTCHVGIDNPTMKGQPQPLAVHSGDLLEHHPMPGKVARRFRPMHTEIPHIGPNRFFAESWSIPVVAAATTKTTCTVASRISTAKTNESSSSGRANSIRRFRAPTTSPGAKRWCSKRVAWAVTNTAGVVVR